MDRADDIVVVEAVRTPFGRFDGLLKTTLSMDLGVMVLKEILKRTELDPQEVDEVYYGTCIPAEYAIYTNLYVIASTDSTYFVCPSHSP